jgi:hypothetical protein
MKYSLIGFFVWCLYSTTAVADDVDTAIDQGKELYKSGNFKQAITQLEYAAGLIREMRGNSLSNFLPPALPNWSMDESESHSAGAAMFGGGTNVSRAYHKGDTTVRISITADSPMLQSIMMMLSNPFILQSQGGKLRMIKGQQVVFNQDGAMAVINNSYLVQVEKDGQAGSDIDPDVMAYTQAIDFDGIKNAN